MLPNDEYGDSNQWVTCDQGHTHWGSNGAAGMLLRHTDPHSSVTRYFLQQRGPEVQNPGTWSTPGGAIENGETPHAAAIREAQEELGDFPLMNLNHLHTLDHGGWAYHTMVGDVPHPFYPQHADAAHGYETTDSGWFTPAEIDELPLHPGFREGWDQYKPNQRPSARSVWSNWMQEGSGWDVPPMEVPPITWNAQGAQDLLTYLRQEGWSDADAMDWILYKWHKPHVTASNFMHEWNPGSYGKGIVLPTGRVLKWSVGDWKDGDPAHDAIVARTGYDKNPALAAKIHYFAMDPQGQLRYVTNDAGELPHPRIIRKVLDSHPALKPPTYLNEGLVIGSRQAAYAPDPNAPEEGEWIREPDPSGAYPNGIATGWRQNHQRLVQDALRSWKGSPTDMNLHMEDLESTGGNHQQWSRAQALRWELENNARLTEVPLWRGAPREPGGYAPWSEAQDAAEVFKFLHGPRGEMYELPPGAQGLRLEDYGIGGLNEHEKEWIINHHGEPTWRRLEATQFVPELWEQAGKSTEPQEVNNPEDHWPDWGETPPSPSGTHTDYDWAITRV